ncbi:2-haloalkanoic acid dehalogenase [Thermococcus litoralis DSM 5473]|uniref:2-haloalkanoic acid dehalogenase n=1 Tax=Thermococcus litoralis (strain ATCC 51850 / DSM 5473 / JCM 8560 / NS-C) TaxID=523849 RepID=H3ZMP1_THELN|nr:HAD family hydrolase [Thermococcus litoralis]EHR78769.1 2-haloalkanoic acid dehalogenase [Thermococcus litoralis DSM 5473]
MLKALIFDVDETLVYYEHYNDREWFEKWGKKEIEKLGISVDYETYKKMVKGELPRSWVEKLGVDHVEFWKAIDRAKLDYRKWAAEMGLIKAFPDVDALENFKQMGLKMAAVSNASQDCTEFVLELYDLKKYFDVILGKDYRYLDGAKPNPYLIKKALDALEVLPSEALVVGDSASDILAAHGAGVSAVQVMRFGKIEGADYYVKDLKELVQLVRSLMDKDL